MEPSTTRVIVESLTRAIVEHRLLPGTKLAEQKLADHFGVSRTLVRHALFQLSQNRLKFVPWIGWDEFWLAAGSVAILGPLLTLLPTLVLTRKYLKV
mgnify:CR=1 FL=1